MATLSEQAVALIRRSQLRLTKQRQSLIDILASSPERYLEVTYVDQLMRQQYPGVSHNTIYRNLEEFQTAGIVEITQRSHGKAVKLSCDQEAHEHHHHFICQECGRVTEIHMKPFDLEFYQAQLPGAEITGHEFELYGRCADCVKKHE
ncbi:Fur family transcriptional regulator [Limosilactobacillus gastricus]|uniref:Fur family transcriptional regulator n=1 Tax=Limosilactobacillus gastricus TaxID=227942 RepID=UPI0026F1F0CF|nr:Fur family transcriptional regulator [Limosilactobacillus gastricus]